MLLMLITMSLRLRAMLLHRPIKTWTIHLTWRFPKLVRAPCHKKSSCSDQSQRPQQNLEKHRCCKHKQARWPNPPSNASSVLSRCNVCSATGLFGCADAASRELVCIQYRCNNYICNQILHLICSQMAQLVSV